MIQNTIVRPEINVFIRTNEDVGMYIEKLICDICNITFNTKRKKPILKVSSVQQTAFTQDIENLAIKFSPREHLGNLNKEHDFKLHDGHLSVKTNISSCMVCPQIIGQTSAKRISKYLSIPEMKTHTDFKRHILQNSKEMLQEYLDNILYVNSTLWLLDFPNGVMYEIKANNILRKPSLNICENDLVVFTKPTLEDWTKSSNSCGIKKGNSSKVPIGEYQVNSKCCKFRFNLRNLINNGLISDVDVQTFTLGHRYNFARSPNVDANIVVVDVINVDTLVEQTAELSINKS